MKLQFLVPVLATLTIGTFSAQSPRTHRLEATPATVAYGYYWSEAKPVLRIASGDIVDVDTLLTNTPKPAFAVASSAPAISASAVRMMPPSIFIGVPHDTCRR